MFSLRIIGPCSTVTSFAVEPLDSWAYNLDGSTPLAGGLEPCCGKIRDEGFLMSVHLVMILSVISVLPVQVLGQAESAKVKRSPTGIFSNMQFNGESGDIVGTEIFITFGGGEYWAQVQIAEGEPFAPKLVKLKLQDNKISFDLPEDFTEVHNDANGEKETPIHQLVHYEFEIKADHLVGGSQDNLLDLKRSNTYWQTQR
jgi:hypothetical protein